MEQLYEDPILQLMFIIGYKTVSIVLVPGSVERESPYIFSCYDSISEQRARSIGP